MAFTSRPVSAIKADYNGQSGQLSIGGITSDATLTAANSAAQINKILAVVNKEVVASKMTRVITQEGDAD